MNVTATCQSCGVQKQIEVATWQMRAWRNGTPIQSAMPFLTKEQQGLLTLGLCQECIKKTFSEE